MANQLSRSELKDRVFAFLRRTRDTQYENLVQLGLEQPLNRRLSMAESQVLLEIIFELFSANILMPAADRHNTGWPFFSVTSHGQEVLAASGPPVYDYDGYLADLRSRTRLDPIVERFVGEALRAYQAHLYLSAVAMLGAASEKAIRKLISAYLDSIADETNREKLRSRIDGRDISAAYRKFKESFDSTAGQLPSKQLPKEFDTHIDSVFTFSRLLRNAVLHSDELPPITHAVVFGSLQQFSYYLPTIAIVTEALKKVKITV